jgi:signal transduction histidine kinase
MVVSHDRLMAVAARVQSIDAELVAIGTALRPYAYIGAPLVVRRRVVGAISFGRTANTPHDYEDADIELVEEFARRVSIAVENARLFRQADELNRLKDEFLATVSHELRTPLSAILGWSRLLSGGQLDSNKMARALDVIERNAQLQSKLVDDILDVARGTAGNVRLEVKSLDLGTIAHRGADAIAPTAAAKHIGVEVDAPTPVIVSGDAARLQQVVWNLLTNAVKFTPGGGRVSIAVSAQNGFAELRVSDTGSGIPPNFLPYVFDKFRQADASFTRQYGGLGLGLAIARHLVELHGGAVEARSEGQGQGATFIVRLPAA